MSKKKILLKNDEHSAKLRLTAERQAKERFESIIKSVERFFNKELTHKEKKELFELKGKFVENEFMKTAQFPQSALDFNLDAVEKKAQYYALLSEVKFLHKTQYINLISGKLVIDEEAIKESTRRYIETDLQQEVYDIAVELLPLIVRLDELKVIEARYIHEALKVINSSNSNMKRNFKINLDYIDHLKMFRK